jgi:hypothetical protein
VGFVPVLKPLFRPVDGPVVLVVPLPIPVVAVPGEPVAAPGLPPPPGPLPRLRHAPVALMNTALSFSKSL